MKCKHCNKTIYKKSYVKGKVHWFHRHNHHKLCYWDGDRVEEKNPLTIAKP